MKKIAIVGAGGFGREVYCIIEAINKTEPTWEFIGFFDDGKPVGSSNEYGKILGDVEAINQFGEPLDIVVAIGNGSVVEKIVHRISNPKVNFPNIIAPGTIFSDKENFKIGHGNIVAFRSWFSCNVEMGNFNVLNVCVTVGHDAKIGSFNSIMPFVAISGEVRIGNCNFIGVNAAILQQIVIGNNVRIGAGSVVIRKTQDNMLYVGNPAVKMNV